MKFPNPVPDVSLVRLPERASHGISGLLDVFASRVCARISKYKPFMHSEDIFFLVNISLLSDGILSA
jgi:hypothetical protein